MHREETLPLHLSGRSEGVCIDFSQPRARLRDTFPRHNPMANERGACVSFGVYEFDPRMGELRKHGIRIKLQDKPAALLALLVEKPGELLTHGELHAKLWPEEPYGDPHRLNVAVNKLRAALSDTAANPRFLETLPRRGYRFLAPLNVRPDRAAGSGKKMVAVLP